MTAFTGTFADVDREYDAETWNAGLGGHNTVGPAKSVRDTSSAIFGAFGDEQPISGHGQAQTGQFAHQYGFLDWFNRMHIQFSTVDLGNLVSDQVRQVEIFSTYFVQRELTAVNATGDEGLTLTLPGALPLTWAPFQSRYADLTASTDGPATIDAAYEFVFDSGTLDMGVSGTRVILWQFAPDWLTPVVERLEWLTSITRTYNGKEQRIRLRGAPRSAWEFTFNVHGIEANLLDSVIYEWQGRVWALPIWPDGTPITAAVSPGDTVVSCDTQYRDFHVGGLAVLMTADGQTYEAFEVASFTATTVTSTRPLNDAWPLHTGIFPTRTARLAGGARWRRQTARSLAGAVSFQCTEAIERTAATEATYRSYPVLTVEPNWREGLEYEYERMIEAFDNLTAPEITVDDPAPTFPIQSWLWTCADRAEGEALRQFLYARQGRCRAIWLPTWQSDLHLTSTISAAATNIDVTARGLKQFLRAGVHRRDIRIELLNGTVFYRRCSAYVEVSEGVERMTINSALGQSVAPTDVLRISWMMLARMTADTAEIAWRSPAVGEVAFSLTGFNNDV